MFLAGFNMKEDPAYEMKMIPGFHIEIVTPFIVY